MAVNAGAWPVIGQLLAVMYAPKNPDNASSHLRSGLPARGVRHPAAGGRGITVSRTPYRGITPEARASAPAGIPGTPGIPDADPASSSVPGSVVKPAPDNAETEPLEGACQPAGTDNGPIEFARAKLAVTAVGRPPKPDAAPFN